MAKNQTAQTESTITKEQTVKKAPKAPKATKADKVKEPKVKKAPKAPEAPKVKQEEMDWATLTPEQKFQLKESLLKSKYGKGGENFSSFPTLLDNKINTWVEAEYQISKLPKRVTPQTYGEWAGNGHITILPLEMGNGKTHFMVILLPIKDLTLQTYNLNKGGDNTLEYTTHTKADKVTLTSGDYLITNIYTNKNKAFHQAKALGKLFKLGTPPEVLEKEKEVQSNYLKLDITDKGERVYNHITKAGNTKAGHNTLETYLTRKPIKQLEGFNYLEQLL